MNICEPGQNKIPNPHAPVRDFLVFFMRASSWGILTYFLAKSFAIYSVWIVILSVYFFSVPIILSRIYCAIISQIRRLHIFQACGMIYRIFSGRPLKVLFWIAYSLLTSFFMLIQFHTFTPLEWFAFFLVIPVFWLTFTLIRRLCARELKPYIVSSMALAWSTRLCPVLMLFLYLFIIKCFGQTMDFSSIQEAIDAKKSMVSDMTGSALVWEYSQWLATYEGIKIYAVGRMNDVSAFYALLILGLGEFVIFFNSCSILSCFLIPLKEYYRIFTPLSDVEVPPCPSTTRMAVVVAITTFITLFLYVQFVVYLEAYIRQNPEYTQARISAESLIVRNLEKIDDDYFAAGTIAKLQDAQLKAMRQIEVSRTNLEREVDRAFERLEAHVDPYLDWYYSLVGEYSRIAQLLIGEIEAFMMQKLDEFLQQKDAFRDVQSALMDVLATHESAMNTYREIVQQIMNENRVGAVEFPVHVMNEISLEQVVTPSIHKDMISLKTRLSAASGAGATAGVATGIVVGKITNKIAAKNIIKLAAKTFLKVVVSKAAGTAGGAGAGAVAGGAVGSFVPGVGTMIGAAIGAVIGGVFIGVSVDKLLLLLEEEMNREEFKNQILVAIQEARTEFKNTLHGTRPEPLSLEPTPVEEK